MSSEIEVTPQRTQELLRSGEAVVVDVREPYEREAGHIEGTRHIELPDLAAQAESLPRDRPIVLHCRVGARSLMAAQALRGAGFDAYSMAGGLLRWDDEGLPVDGGGDVAAHWPEAALTDWAALLDEAELRASRSSGPGGQHANVTASRIEAVLDVDASAVLSEAQKARIRAAIGPRVSAVAQDARSQARNKEVALERLRHKLERALHVPRKRRPTKPTKGSKTRRLDAKRRQGERKRDRRRPADD